MRYLLDDHAELSQNGKVMNAWD